MILGGQDVEVEPLLRADLGDLLDVGGARRRHDGLALEIVDGLQVGGLLRHEAVGGDEMGDGEGDLLLPLEIVGGRAAFEIDGAVGHQRDARGRGDRIELGVELVELELALHRDRRSWRRGPWRSRRPAAGRRNRKTAPTTSRCPSVIAPVSLIFFSVPVSSWARAGAAPRDVARSAESSLRCIAVSAVS